MASRPTSTIGAPEASTSAAAVGSTYTFHSAVEDPVPSPATLPGTLPGTSSAPPITTIEATCAASSGSARKASATLVSGPRVSTVTPPWRRVVPSRSVADRSVAGIGPVDRSSPQPLSASSRHSVGNAWSPARGVDRPHATGTPSSPVTESRLRMTLRPCGQRTSPVPETVTARTSASVDERRNANATRSSTARSVSTTTGTAAPVAPPAGRACDVAPSPPPQADASDATSTAVHAPRNRGAMRTTPRRHFERCRRDVRSRQGLWSRVSARRRAVGARPAPASGSDRPAAARWSPGRCR